MDSNFVITSLTDPSQLDPEWFDHLGLVFTSTPRSYFVNHWDSDPFRKIEGNKFDLDSITESKGIFVAREKDTNKLASTVRVFWRKMYYNG